MSKLLDHVGKRVEVFLDLSPGPKRWIVRSHLDKVSPGGKTRLNGLRNEKTANLTVVVGLTDCVFRVSEKKRQQCLKDTRGYVDAAWVIGTLVDPDDVSKACTERVTWNPALPTFVWVDTELTIEHAEKVLFRIEQVNGKQKGRVFVPPLKKTKRPGAKD